MELCTLSIKIFTTICDCQGKTYNNNNNKKNKKNKKKTTSKKIVTFNLISFKIYIGFIIRYPLMASLLRGICEFWYWIIIPHSLKDNKV